MKRFIVKNLAFVLGLGFFVISLFFLAKPVEPGMEDVRDGFVMASFLIGFVLCIADIVSDKSKYDP